MRVMWDNVVLLAQSSIAKTLPGMTIKQRATYKRDGVLATETAPTRNALPLTDALRQLLFSILYNTDESWVSEISSATVAKIRTIADELPQHRAACERSEGGPMRSQTVSPEQLLDLLRREAAATENITRVFGAGDRGDAPPRVDSFSPNEDQLRLLSDLDKSLYPLKATHWEGKDDMHGYDTILDLLKELERKMLVDRPRGKNSGFAITEAGRELLRRNGLKKQST
jgi:hypothetical protein